MSSRAVTVVSHFNDLCAQVSRIQEGFSDEEDADADPENLAEARAAKQRGRRMGTWQMVGVMAGFSKKMIKPLKSHL